ncbi:hypothetical protein SAMN06265173_107115 [Thalassovita litoralis]|jgi:hypothetical protein|uniref:Uncharacterized protein n=1 Tax=Thalassovita litoralis TaxID=1010611 RepID=A0A521CUN2_9RHOB|nr:hypothetical protein [Thalassovita litoralis]SMO62431.1 hypothetical protein SAMN06265173_107115 [Thalassovita litoralis]
MSLIRPEAATTLKRWAEPLIAVGLSLFGLSLGLTGLGVVKWAGFLFTAIGAALLILGIRRARFWQGSDGAGVVEVDEAAITYFGPEGGGAIPVGDLDKIVLVQRHSGKAWWLTSRSAPPLIIPVNASGTQMLFDVFANLPGMDMQALLRVLDSSGPNDVVIWQRNGARLH